LSNGSTERNLWAGKYEQGLLYRVLTECGQSIDLAEATQAERAERKIWCPIHQRFEAIATLIRRVRV
jgi:hypothetical protein